MFEVNPHADEQFKEWFNAPAQRIKRALLALLGFEFSLQVLGKTLTSFAVVGVFHNKPHFTFGFGYRMFNGIAWVALAFSYQCGDFEVVLANDVVYVHRTTCASCAKDIERITEANDRIVQNAMGRYHKRQQDNGNEDNSGNVPASPRDPSSPSGSMMDWP